MGGAIVRTSGTVAVGKITGGVLVGIKAKTSVVGVGVRLGSGAVTGAGIESDAIGLLRGAWVAVGALWSEQALNKEAASRLPTRINFITPFAKPLFSVPLVN